MGAIVGKERNSILQAIFTLTIDSCLRTFLYQLFTEKQNLRLVQIGSICRQENKQHFLLFPQYFKRLFPKWHQELSNCGTY